MCGCASRGLVGVPMLTVMGHPALAGQQGVCAAVDGEVQDGVLGFQAAPGRAAALDDVGAARGEGLVLPVPGEKRTQ